MSDQKKNLKETVRPLVDAGRDASKGIPATAPFTPNFATDTAAEAWIEAGQPDLRNEKGSSKSKDNPGGFTVADIERIAAGGETS